MPVKFWIVVLLAHMKDHLVPRTMLFTASQYLFWLQSDKGLNLPNQRDTVKGLGTMDSAKLVTSYG